MKVLIAINALSVFDFLLTMNLMRAGLVSEGNPAIASLILVNPLVALVFKVSLVLLVTGVFWRFRRYRPVALATTTALAVFAVVVVYQLALHVLLG